MINSIDEGRELEEIEYEYKGATYHQNGLTQPIEGKRKYEVDKEEAVQQEKRVEDRPLVALASHESLVHFSELGLVFLILEHFTRRADEVENRGGKKQKSEEEEQRNNRRDDIGEGGERELELKANYIKHVDE